MITFFLRPVRRTRLWQAGIHHSLFDILRFKRSDRFIFLLASTFRAGSFTSILERFCQKGHRFIVEDGLVSRFFPVLQDCFNAGIGRKP
jgi:hypothetical protein